MPIQKQRLILYQSSWFVIGITTCALIEIGAQKGLVVIL